MPGGLTLTILKTFIRYFEQLPLHGVHAHGLFGRDREKRSIEKGDVFPQEEPTSRLNLNFA